MQLVVVMAVRKAVSAATITFTATSMNLFFMTLYHLFIIHYSLFTSAAPSLCQGLRHHYHRNFRPY